MIEVPLYGLAAWDLGLRVHGFGLILGGRAAENGHFRMVAALFAAGADPDVARAWGGKTVARLNPQPSIYLSIYLSIYIYIYR